MNYNSQEYENAIAIIGMSGRFPKCKDINEYWEMICAGDESMVSFTNEELEKFGVKEEEYLSPNYVPVASLLEDYEKFDNDFFDINPKEAELMDPQQRLFLQVCYEALESAGYCTEKSDSIIGVFGGSSMNSFLIHNLLNNREFVDNNSALQHVFIHGNMNDYLCTRVSYKLNLNGPSVSVQSACSTSAVATYIACQSLLNYDCDIALTGGVSVRVPQYSGYKTVEGGIFSTDGHCRAFDDNSEGTIFGSGVGVIALKRLDDAINDNDNVIAIIRGMGINNDGNLKVGYTAPSVEGQRNSIIQAIDFGEVDPEEIGYVEMHGTGTKMGDLIEIRAIDSAYKRYTSKNNYCPIGSVKANIGHLNAAAGIASIIKTALVVKNGMIPPAAAFEKPNSEIKFSETPFYVNTDLKYWKNNQRIAGVSSFGIGGTNVHFIIENYVSDNESSAEDESNVIFTFSGKTEKSVLGNLNKTLDYFKYNSEVDLVDSYKTLLWGRRTYNYRISAVASSREELINMMDTKLENNDVTKIKKNSKIAFLFTGQGSHYPGFLKELYNSSKFIKTEADKCFELLKQKVDFEITENMFFELDSNNTEIVQPILFIWEYVVAKYLIKIGVRPNILLGHSLGEYVAACISDVFTLEDIITILAHRGVLTSKIKEGKMLSVSLSPKEITKYLNSEISLSIINSDNNCVISGEATVINQLEDQLINDNVIYKELRNTRAFHSHMMNELYSDFAEYVDQFELNSPCIPIISNINGEIDSDINTGEYWAKHLCNVVRFDKCVNTLLENENLLIVEIGTGTICKMVNSMFEEGQDYVHFVRDYKNQNDDVSHTLECLAKLWEYGQNIDWKLILSDFDCSLNYKKVDLPTYTFDTNVFALGEKCFKSNDEDKIQKVRRGLSSKYVAPRNEVEEECVRLWSDALGIEEIGIDDDFFELGGHSLIASSIFTEINELFDLNISAEIFKDKRTVREISNLIINNMFGDN